MPQRSLRPCRHPSCAVLVSTGYCPKHEETARIKRNNEQKTDWLKPFYNSRLWRLTRTVVIARDLICQKCRQALPSAVHHIIDARVWVSQGHDFYDPTNLEALCKRCHDQITGSRQHE